MRIVPSDEKHVDALFSLGAREVIGVTDPYLLAASFYRSDPNKSLELAQQIVNRYPETDSNVFWRHHLIGTILLDQQKFGDAVVESCKAIAPR